MAVAENARLLRRPTAYLAAQRNLANLLNSAQPPTTGGPLLSEVLLDYELAFRASAVAASEARESGITLQALADANREACQDLLATSLGQALYISVEAVAYHALTGDLLRLPTDPSGDPVMPTGAQALVVRTKRERSTSVVRAAIAKSSTQQEAIAALNLARVQGTIDGSRLPVRSGSDAEAERLARRLVTVLAEGARLSRDSVSQIQSLLDARSGQEIRR